tara:strand:- start:6640 stop:8361 length:1722 start_codon:yes stop_codon:yes gene_type:complete
MNNLEIAKKFQKIGTFLELKGENPFKVRAYLNAARVLENLQEDISSLIEKEKLTEVKGIGTALEEKITELMATGKLKYYDDLKNSIPPGLIEMLAISGMGPKKVNIIYRKLKIRDIGELEYACNENRLIDLEGFGKKSQENILKGIKNLKKYQNFHLYNSALLEAEVLLENLKKNKNTISISIAGSLRRKKEVVKDIDLVAGSKKPDLLMNAFVANKLVESVVSHGKTKSSVTLKSGINADLRVVKEEEFPFALHHFTGSKEHNTDMRNRAKKNDLKMNEYGLFKHNKLISCNDEMNIFKKLGLAYIPPELREGLGELEAAEKGRIPHLIEEKDIQGIFHVHTNYSDGNMNIREIIQVCKKLGYQYVGISDHSQAAAYANGLKEEDIIEQRKEIKKINKSLNGFKIFHGIEADILPDGEIDYGSKILSGFDFVIASVHSNFAMGEKEMTERIIKAIENPYVTMLGHPTGRLLLAREPYSVNLKEVIDVAASHNVIIELNANPHRLDLDWKWCRYAKEKKIKISINPDAHSIEGLNHTVYGIEIARKGWLTRKDCFNTLGTKEIEASLKSKKKK